MLGLRRHRSSCRRCSHSPSCQLTAMTGLPTPLARATNRSIVRSGISSHARILCSLLRPKSNAQTSRWMSSSGGCGTSGRRRGCWERTFRWTSRPRRCRGSRSTRHAAASSRGWVMAFRGTASLMMGTPGTSTSGMSPSTKTSLRRDSVRCTVGFCTCSEICVSLVTDARWIIYFIP